MRVRIISARLRSLGYPEAHPVFDLFWGEPAVEVDVASVAETASGAEVLVLENRAMLLRDHARVTRD